MPTRRRPTIRRGKNQRDVILNVLLIDTLLTLFRLSFVFKISRVGRVFYLRGTEEDLGWCNYTSHTLVFEYLRPRLEVNFMTNLHFKFTTSSSPLQVESNHTKPL